MVKEYWFDLLFCCYVDVICWLGVGVSFFCCCVGFCVGFVVGGCLFVGCVGCVGGWFW